MLIILLTPLGLPLLFGERFRPAIPAALILVVAGAFNSCNLALEAGLQGLGRPRSVMKAEAIGLVVTGLTLVILLPAWGIVGAAMASLLAYGTVTAFLLWQLIGTIRLVKAGSEASAHDRQ